MLGRRKVRAKLVREWGILLHIGSLGLIRRKEIQLPSPYEGLRATNCFGCKQ